ncbi:bifunctional glutamate N-acetyltransferase/amino-acid acetyltransferase ArgJ [Marininema halotolerans]|nr:bifunctional glutamate N-acetyltransferase/amino-acid acetyltransferase ArgJ [Marininema halotolerans]
MAWVEPHEKKSTFTQVKVPTITSPKGFTASGLHAGIKRKRKDLGMIYCEVPAAAAVVYTTNAFQAAPLVVTQDGMKVDGYMQAILVNSGKANACTGEPGLQDAYQMRQSIATEMGLPAYRVGIASTGVIGERIPMEPLTRAVPTLVEQLGKEGGDPFSQSILTTDTGVKVVEVRFFIDGKEVRISGVAKGSGMIHPNMATMLAFMTTDAVIEPSLLQTLLREVTDETYNMITVDGDSSTNDMVVAMASGMAGHRNLTPEHEDWLTFQQAFAFVSKELARMIARDGEGATRLVEVEVKGARTLKEARQAAKTVVGSSLVKTAVYGADPNWGRILSAIGYSDATVVPSHTRVWLGDVVVVDGGTSAIYDEKLARKALEQSVVQIKVDLGAGKERATAWGCDLTYDYVRINASYRT